MEKPAPAAVPLTAVISTASMRANDEMARCRSSATPLMWRPRLGAVANDLRSPPAQKNRPEPVSTTTFVASVSQRLAASANSRVIVSFMPFAASGRFRVMRAMGPDCSSVMVWYSVTLDCICAGLFGCSPGYGTLSCPKHTNEGGDGRQHAEDVVPAHRGRAEVRRGRIHRFAVVRGPLLGGAGGTVAVAAPGGRLLRHPGPRPGHPPRHAAQAHRRIGRRLAPQAARRPGHPHRGARAAGRRCRRCGPRRPAGRRAGHRSRPAAGARGPNLHRPHRRPALRPRGLRDRRVQ